MTEPPTPPPRGAAGVAALLAENARIRERLERVENALTEITDAVPAIRETLVGIQRSQQAETDRRSASGVPWLPDLDDAAADVVLDDLHTWVQDVLMARYPREAGRLPPCWARHPVAVDVLLAVRAAWHTAIVAGTDPEAAVRWHLVTRPQAGEQIRETLGCSPGVKAKCNLDEAAGSG